MGRRLVILDPAFSQGEGHHLAANRLLAAHAQEAGFDQVQLVCRHDCLMDGTDIADTTPVEIVPQFTSTPYATARVGDLHRLSRLTAEAQADFDALPDTLLQDGDLLLIHTVNEIQFIALARWLAQVLPGRDLHVHLALMFPVGLDFDAGTVLGVRDAAAAMIYHHGAALLEPYADQITWMGIGRSIAEEFSLLTGRDVAHAPALVPNIGVDLAPKPDTDVPNIILYMGDAKFDKGFHHLPSVIRRLRASPRDFRATVQISGGLIRNFPDMQTAIEEAAGDDPRFDLHHGRLSDEDYETIWQQGHVALLGYDPGVYRYKSSGLCWEAMNYAVPAVVLEGTFHHREITSYGFDPVVVSRYWPEALMDGLDTALEQVAQAGADWLAARAQFTDPNRPDLYFPPQDADHNGSRHVGSGEALVLADHVPGWQLRMFERLFAQPEPETLSAPDDTPEIEPEIEPDMAETASDPASDPV